MNKIKAFLMGFVLLIITFIIIVLVALLYRANDRMQIKSYIFQMQNMSKQRVGILQDINDISPEDLRNKLIKKYVSEYFKVIPGETNIERPVLKVLSGVTAYEKWKNTEAKTIAQMSGQNKFRMVHVYDDGIATLDRPADYSYTDTFYKKIYYSVRYYTQTWNEPNKMATTPVLNQGTIYIEAMFKPGIIEEVDVRKYLEQGGDPILLFDFTVTYIGSKEI